ncbi:MAG TPA: FIST N-terminal domain-containing protein [Nitrospiraceae bacterium]|nr:FIST N-terminal domain-containing protein [Nitrospiraceae bacterium]
MAIAQSSTLQFASSLTSEQNPAAAAESLLAGIRRQFGGSSADLAVLFLSSHYGDEAAPLLSSLRAGLSPRVLIGCSGEGVIGAGREIEGGVAASLWAARLPRTKLTPLRLSFSSLHDQFTMAGWPDTFHDGLDSAPVLLLFADPFSTPMQEVLPLLEDRYPGSIAIGGLAGGGRDIGENRLILNETLYDSGLTGVALSGGISVKTVVSQGCRPIGERYIVTKAEQNLIHELGGVPALHCLQHVYQSLEADERELAHRALHIGIAMDEHRARFEQGDFLVRNLIGADQETGAVVIGDIVQEGQTVQFQVRDARSAHEDLCDLLAACRGNDGPSPLGALLFSCCGRGKGLFGRVNHDVSVIEEQMGPIPVSGFFAQGEIGPIGGRSFLHGYTASIAIFGERPLSRP